MHLVRGRRSVKDISLCSAGIEPVASGFPEQGIGDLGLITQVLYTLRAYSVGNKRDAVI